MKLAKYIHTAPFPHSLLSFTGCFTIYSNVCAFIFIGLYFVHLYRDYLAYCNLFNVCCWFFNIRSYILSYILVNCCSFYSNLFNLFMFCCVNFVFIIFNLEFYSLNYTDFLLILFIFLISIKL